MKEDLALWEKAQNTPTAPATEDYLKQYPSGLYSELALTRLDALLAKAGEKKVAIQSSVNNPYTKGSASGLTRYTVGDQFTFVNKDLWMSDKVTKTYTEVVTSVNDGETEINNGEKVLDLLGNEIKAQNSRYLTPAQFYPNTYAIGQSWKTTYRWNSQRNFSKEVTLNLAVVDRERIETAAGIFNAFKIVGRGFHQDDGKKENIIYWIDPEKCSCIIVFERRTYFARNGNGMDSANRRELVSFTQRRLG